MPRLLLRRCVDLLRLKKLCLPSLPDISFLVALNCAVASSSARALFGIVPFCTSWLLRPTPNNKLSERDKWKKISTVTSSSCAFFRLITFQTQNSKILDVKESSSDRQNFIQICSKGIEHLILKYYISTKMYVDVEMVLSKLLILLFDQ